MFGKQESRRQKAERVAGQAWDQLNSAVDTAGSSARTARKRAESAYEDAHDRLGSGTKEARRRASDAYDALMGRHQRHTPWGLLALAGLFGAVAGWVATIAGRKALVTRPGGLHLPDSLEDEFVKSPPYQNQP
jgi:ElaB/YqjD/DUF883 family membrane-anchored ribosome-binding protein